MAPYRCDDDKNRKSIYFWKAYEWKVLFYDFEIHFVNDIIIIWFLISFVLEFDFVPLY